MSVTLYYYIYFLIILNVSLLYMRIRLTCTFLVKHYLMLCGSRTVDKKFSANKDIDLELKVLNCRR